MAHYSDWEKPIEFTAINVSDLFFEIYKDFNVVSQVEKMKTLDKRELYLLLLVCLDNFNDEDPIFAHNISSFSDEVMELYQIMDDKKTENPILIDMIKETGDKYIDTDYIRYNGNRLPDPLTTEEVRERKLNMIIKK